MTLSMYPSPGKIVVRSSSGTHYTIRQDGGRFFVYPCWADHVMYEAPNEKDCLCFIEGVECQRAESSLEGKITLEEACTQVREDTLNSVLDLLWDFGDPRGLLAKAITKLLEKK